MVVAVSVLLRLGTGVDAAGYAASIIPAGVETAARLAHRVAATGVAVLALLAVVAVRSRKVPAAQVAAVAAIAVLTASLAAIGPFTTGYRLAWVTVANVVCGITLACAFWWLRVVSLSPGTASARAAIIPGLALAAVLAHAGLGAAASDLAMHGGRGLDPLHVSLGIAVLGIAVASSVRRDATGAVAIGLAVLILSLLQLVLGLFLAAGEARALAMQWMHAMLACALALALTTRAARASGQRVYFEG